MAWVLPGDPRGKYWGESDDAYWRRQQRGRPSSRVDAREDNPVIPQYRPPAPAQLQTRPAVGTPAWRALQPAQPAASDDPYARQRAFGRAGSRWTNPAIKPTAAAGPTLKEQFDAAVAKLSDPSERFRRFREMPETKAQLALMAGQRERLEGAANPYAMDDPEYARYVASQQERIGLGYGPREHDTLAQMAAMGGTSGARQAMKASLAGSAASDLSAASRALYEQQYQNRTGWEERRNAALQNMLQQEAGFGLKGSELDLAATTAGVDALLRGAGYAQRGYEFGETQKQADRHFNATLAQADKHFTMRYNQLDEQGKARIKFAYDQLIQEGHQFDADMNFKQTHTLTANDQFWAGIWQSFLGTAGEIGGATVSTLA